MTTSTYLDSVLKIMPAVQARQISDLLQELKVAGEIRNADEYKAKLNQLASLINDTSPKPSFQQIRSLIWHLAYAEAHNYMMKSAQNDIEALFTQINQIGEKVDDHHFLIMKNLAADMERGLMDQENNIARLEWLASNKNEFTNVLVNAFTSSSLLSVRRSEVGSESLYFDNRTYKNCTELELPSAVVSEHGRVLLLSPTNNPQILPVSAKLNSDSNSYGTIIHTEVDNNILNLTDGARGTFWTRNVYLAEPVEKVTSVIEFDLGTAKDINYIIIEGGSEFAFLIESIQAIAPSGHRTNLITDSIEINGWSRINIPRTIVRAVQITFSVPSYIKADYITNSKASALNIFDETLKYDPDTTIENLSPAIAESLTSEYLAKALNVGSGSSVTVNSFLYSLVLDNVWFGNSIYNDSGVFVSKPLIGNDFGVVGVDAQEYLETEENIDNAIEYEIIKRDTSPKFKEVKFPVPLLDQTEVTNERLLLTGMQDESSLTYNVGILRFCPWVDPDASEFSLVNDPPIQVYCNGEEIYLGTNYEFAINVGGDNKLSFSNSWTSPDTRNFDNYQLQPRKMWIRIKQPDSSAVYTTNYTIRTSDTHVESDKTMWLDKDQMIFLAKNGRVYIRKENVDVSISSELYLQITLRRNTASQSATPELRKYAILGASYYV